MRGQKPLIHLIHPTFCPGLFAGCVKRNLMGDCAENLSELLVCIQVILRAMPGETLVEVFLKWMK
jgi:hypothetical protein